MVQMKGAWLTAKQKGYFHLYIPHGSDESYGEGNESSYRK